MQPDILSHLHHERQACVIEVHVQWVVLQKVLSLRHEPQHHGVQTRAGGLQKAQNVLCHTADFSEKPLTSRGGQRAYDSAMFGMRYSMANTRVALNAHLSLRLLVNAR